VPTARAGGVIATKIADCRQAGHVMELPRSQPVAILGNIIIIVMFIDSHTLKQLAHIDNTHRRTHKQLASSHSDWDALQLAFVENLLLLLFGQTMMMMIEGLPDELKHRQSTEQSTGTS
jgi:hypothetical protein